MDYSIGRMIDDGANRYTCWICGLEDLAAPEIYWIVPTLNAPVPSPRLARIALCHRCLGRYMDWDSGDTWAFAVIRRYRLLAKSLS